MERPPSELAKDAYARAKVAYAAGARAWQDQNAPAPVDA
jgi:hypothetical protein